VKDWNSCSIEKRAARGGSGFLGPAAAAALLALLAGSWALSSLSCASRWSLSRSPSANRFARYERISLPRPDGSPLQIHVSRAASPSPAPLVFFCQGSGAYSLLESREGGGLDDLNEWFFQGSAYADRVRFAFAEKRGVLPGTPQGPPKEERPSLEYLRFDRLENRVQDVLFALEELGRGPGVDRSRVALLGHGEGALVAALAASRAECVTHLGYLGAGGLPRLEERVLMRKRPPRSAPATLGEGDDADGFWEEVARAFHDPASLEIGSLSTSPSQLLSYGLPSPVDALLELEIPIFAAVGDADPFIPEGSADLIRLAFLRRGKDNLTCRSYPGLDHGFMDASAPMEGAAMMPAFPMVRAFDDFCRWWLE